MDARKNSLNFSKEFFKKMKEPNFIPNAKEIKTAGNSKIPCGKSLHKENKPSSNTLKEEAKPKTKPFTIKLKKEKIPKNIPENKPTKVATILFLNKKSNICQKLNPCVSKTSFLKYSMISF